MAACQFILVKNRPFQERINYCSITCWVLQFQQFIFQLFQNPNSELLENSSWCNWRREANLVLNRMHSISLQLLRLTPLVIRVDFNSWWPLHLYTTPVLFWPAPGHTVIWEEVMQGAIWCTFRSTSPIQLLYLHKICWCMKYVCIVCEGITT